MLGNLLSNKKVLFIALVAVLVLIFVFSGGKSAKDTAIEFVEHIHEGEAKKAVSLLSDDLVDDLIDRGDYKTKKVLINNLEKALESSIDSFKDKYGKKWKYNIEYVDSYEEDDTCVVVLDITYSGKSWLTDKEKTDSIEIELIKEGGKWKVTSFPSI